MFTANNWRVLPLIAVGFYMPIDVKKGILTKKPGFCRALLLKYDCD